MKPADDLRGIAGKRVEGAPPHQDAIRRLFGREPLVIEELHHGCVGARSVQMATPATAGLIRRRLSRERVGQHQREEPVLVPACDDTLRRQTEDDRRPAAALSLLRRRLDESSGLQFAQVPADGVGVETDDGREPARVEPV
jgi:hypothetical protein